MSYIREAIHAKEWYPADESLTNMLKASFYYAKPEEPQKGNLIGILSPHSCYSVCLRTAAHSYARINPDSYDRVVLLGTSHHIPLSNCLVSNASEVETPLGNLNTDQEVCRSLVDQYAEYFRFLSKEEDEAEHSHEMQYPLIKYVFGDRDIKIVPILVGSFSDNVEENLVNILSPIITEPRTLFIISSDFFHWGELFHFTNYASSKKPLEQQLQLHDEKALNIISAFNFEHFRFHIEEISGAICGCYSILLILRILSPECQFVRISRSELSPIKSAKDFSISYIAAGFYSCNQAE